MPQETHRYGNFATALPFWSRYLAPFWDHYEQRVPSSWRYQSLKLGGSSQVY